VQRVANFYIVVLLYELVAARQILKNAELDEFDFDQLQRHLAPLFERSGVRAG